MISFRAVVVAWCSIQGLLLYSSLLSPEFPFIFFIRNLTFENFPRSFQLLEKANFLLGQEAPPSERVERVVSELGSRVAALHA